MKGKEGRTTRIVHSSPWYPRPYPRLHRQEAATRRAPMPRAQQQLFRLLRAGPSAVDTVSSGGALRPSASAAAPGVQRDPPRGHARALAARPVAHPHAPSARRCMHICRRTCPASQVCRAAGVRARRRRPQRAALQLGGWLSYGWACSPAPGSASPAAAASRPQRRRPRQHRRVRSIPIHRPARAPSRLRPRAFRPCRYDYCPMFERFVGEAARSRSIKLQACRASRLPRRPQPGPSLPPARSAAAATARRRIRAPPPPRR